MPRKPRKPPQQQPADTQDSATALTPEPSPNETIRDHIAINHGSQTPPERKATIYNCADYLKMSPREIATRLSMDVRTVNAILATRDAEALSARNLLAANSLQFAQDWLDASKIGAGKGKHGPAKDALLHLKVIEPVQDTQTHVQVAIVVGRPRDASLLHPPQVIDTTVDSE